ncbi:MAG: hypothetical protein CMD88_05475 [Gammaproteobacteria bacterium]|nr:hypothetical protein [Gammaproteobacteria bacterium]|tara:strand:+ start:85 stop:306 length:222 start_codon:yes stop_codon:yes gene_type:complete
MIIITLLGIVLFFAVGGFAYNLGGCVAGFLKLDRLVNKQVVQVVFLVAYVYLVFTNKDLVINAYMTPMTNLVN